MKIFIGILSAILVLTGATLTILALWDIYPISWTLIIKSVLTIAIVCTTGLLLWLIKALFLKRDKPLENEQYRHDTNY